MGVYSSIYGIASTMLSNVFVSLPLPTKDLSGQTYIVTGANTGLGFEATKHLARIGAEKIILAVRNLRKGELAKDALTKSTGRSNEVFEVWELDMNKYESVKDFTQKCQSLPRIDGILENAGISTTTFEISEDNEKTITTNVMSTFLLALLLLPILRDSAMRHSITPRITIVGSAVHFWAPFGELDNPNGMFKTMNEPKTADMAGRYFVSKLLDLFGVRELANQFQQKPDIILNCVNPSWCKSSLARISGVPDPTSLRIAEKLLARDTEVGSRTLVHAVLSGRESHGQYLTNCHVAK